jgi:CRP/FNR family cyclic AMP-dependent transcriptional regulator
MHRRTTADKPASAGCPEIDVRGAGHHDADGRGRHCMTDTRADRLRSIRLFADLSPEAREAIADIATEVDFPAERAVVRQGDPGNGMFIVESGRLRVVRDGIAVATLGPGEWVGELSVIDGHPRTASAVTEEPTRCLAISTWDAERLIEQRPDIALSLLRQLAGRLRAADEDHRH